MCLLFMKQIIVKYSKSIYQISRHLNEIRFRNAWANLGSLKRHEAMQEFIEEVIKVMPHLRAYFESLKKDKEEEQTRL